MIGFHLAQLWRMLTLLDGGTLFAAGGTLAIGALTLILARR